MFLVWLRTVLVGGNLQRMFDEHSRLRGSDHRVDITFRCGYIRIGKFVFVLLNLDFPHLGPDFRH